MSSRRSVQVDLCRNRVLTDNPHGTTALLEFPYPPDVAVDARGNRYVADRYGNRILKITLDGKTTTLAGRGAGGDAEGDAGTARFSVPMGVALGLDGHLYVADAGNAKVRKITLPRR